MVFEVDLDGKVIHLKSLGISDSSNKDDVEATPSTRTEQDTAIGSMQSGVGAITSADSESKQGLIEPSERAVVSQPIPDEPWPEHFSFSLAPFLDEARILQVKKMYLEGRDPPRSNDTGWAGRNAKQVNKDSAPTGSVVLATTVQEGNGNERGGRVRGGLQGGRVDGRKVISEVSLYYYTK